MKQLASFLIILMLGVTSLKATTWDEPWADKVIKQASSFVLAKIISNDAEKGVKIFILKTLGGNPLSDSILISDFYSLNLCSTSGGHGAEFHTVVTDSCYFFIQKNAAGKYCIATPTAGFDYVDDGTVIGSFRHTYHQAAIPASIYEMTMTAIFNNYHGSAFDRKSVEDFVVAYLSKKPAGFTEDEIDTFFLQHVALETVYHLNLQIKESLVLPFLNDTTSFHNQVSGARAMRAFNTESNKQELLKAIGDTTRRSFVRVMCIWSLSELKPTKLKSQLQLIAASASDETDGFGGNIMDPRICTHVPTVKEALKELVTNL
jgi:hypothetical protein